MNTLRRFALAWVGVLIVALLVAAAILILASGLFEKVALAVGVVGVAMALAAFVPTQRRLAVWGGLSVLIALVVITLQEVTR